MQIKYKIAAASLALIVTLSACGQKTDISERRKNRSSSERTAESDDIEEETTDEREPDDDDDEDYDYEAETWKDDYSYAYFSFGDRHGSYLEDEQSDAVIKAAESLKPVESRDMTFACDLDDWKLDIYKDGYSIYTRRLSDKGWFITDGAQNIYADSPELTALAVSSASDSSYGTDPYQEKIYYSVTCDEPTAEDEYVDAAVQCTEAWLTSLQSEDTDDYYRNTAFKIFVYDENGINQKCNYLSCGMVDGKKEFVVEICFTAEDCGENTFYDDYYQEGRYTEAGTFWSGQYICGRFRWEDGKCSLIRMTTRDGSGSIQNGLNGIFSENEYRNFYEFARREDYKEALENSFDPYGRYTVSRNLTQTEDGKPINIDIYTFSFDSQTDDTYTAIWDERAYINKQATYSTGLYFTDGGTGHMPDTLPKDFPLTFDNYDNDANPDFCCRYDSDDEGTYYVLESVQTDGRIFNLSGRAFEGGIYIAGCTDPSPRLQRTADICYIGWKKDENGYYPTDSNGERTKLPELNMYSDRLYLPDDLKLYSEDENKVTCFLWNNTASDITTDGTYSIEMNEGGEWKTVAENLQCTPVTVAPREHAEVTFDISSLTERYSTVYRIVLKGGENTALGEFWLEGEDVLNIKVEADDIAVGASYGAFTVTDNGYSPTEIKSAYITDGSSRYEAAVEEESSGRYVFISDSLPQKEGTYTLVVNDAAECNIVFKAPPSDLPEFTIDAAFKDDKLEIDMTCTADCTIKRTEAYKKGDKGWSASTLTAGVEDNFYSELDIKLKKNTKQTVTMRDYYSSYIDDEYLEEIYERFKEYLEEYGDDDEEMKEIGLDKDTTLSEFKEKMKSYYSADPEAEYLIEVVYEFEEKEYQIYVLK